MTTHDDHQRALDEERAANEWYLRRLEAWLSGRQGIAGSVSVPQNSVWTGTGVKVSPSRAVVGPLAGRVGLGYEDDYLGQSFYIGPWHIDDADFVVVSWTTPVARLFYEGRKSDWHDPDPEMLEATRTFDIHDTDVVEFVQHMFGSGDPDPFTKARVSTQAPVPPAPEPAPRPARLRAQPDPVPSSPPSDPDHEDVRPGSEPLRDSETKEIATDKDGSGYPGLRAESVIRRAIERPRSGRLQSVLQTLQPDQYRYVTWPSDKPLVLQGQPGTGKTIVATHRAGYLTHPDNETDRVDSLCLVGPSEEWVQHVREVLPEIGATGVQVASVVGIIRSLAGTPPHELYLENERWFQFEWDTARLGQKAMRQLRGQLTGSDQSKIKSIVEALVRPTDLHRELVTNPETSNWLLGAKSWDYARSRPEYMPFLASVGVAVAPPKGTSQFSHLVVDEAQDLREIEWYILSRFFPRTEGGYSLFGDMNQRRTDCSYPSWHEMAVDLGFGPLDESRFEAEELQVGYRSTRQILDYAAGLLPSGQRHPNALRDGDEPVMTRVGPKQILQEAIAKAEELTDRHPEGTVALITTSPKPYERKLMRGAEGWRKTSNRYELEKDGRKLAVLRPVNARGLEFDGVVVVEPKDFPEQLGRQGQLYTSLTRATKELCVVHSKALPRELKARRS